MNKRLNDDVMHIEDVIRHTRKIRSYTMGLKAGAIRDKKLHDSIPMNNFYKGYIDALSKVKNYIDGRLATYCGIHRTNLDNIDNDTKTNQITLTQAFTRINGGENDD